MQFLQQLKERIGVITMHIDSEEFNNGILTYAFGELMKLLKILDLLLASENTQKSYHFQVPGFHFKTL